MTDIIQEIKSILSTESFAFLISVASISIALVSVLLLKDRKTRYNEKLNRIELDFVRSNYENKIYDLTEKLNSEKSRWMDNNHFFANMPSDNRDITKINQAINPNFFLENMGVKPESINIKPKSVFILTAFNDRYLEDYKSIERACIDIGISVSRGDETRINGDILSYIVSQICSAQLIIANISGRNPNVFYELGIAQALGKPVVIVSKGAKDIPFDLKNRQVIIYDNPADLRLKVQKAVVNAL
ncbi:MULTISPECIES: hypothetical protein [Enterobacteriaceae]|jgi:hypothetical protein|uniref:hypothetical protein n=1 Tax=Enterobacteriaceae TaxID=543 RepID=UPI0004474412|nr:MULTISPECIES: hypothetical protein [Enterobacteriaceae]EKK5548895.1 hypothetical protein [Enterobacter hormaechei]MBG0620741.1 hypothetical protein [Enterobacter roggenkampii]ELD3251403.1 hypothetical protein [Enterobacter hormaechei]EYT04896.1 hypothetical protein T655_03732 [Klebsiella oxytoca G54]MBX4506652.1 hypothetical protein [Klebsiella oxytoca]